MKHVSFPHQPCQAKLHDYLRHSLAVSGTLCLTLALFLTPLSPGSQLEKLEEASVWGYAGQSQALGQDRLVWTLVFALVLASNVGRSTGAGVDSEEHSACLLCL